MWDITAFLILGGLTVVLLVRLLSKVLSFMASPKPDLDLQIEYNTTFFKTPFGGDDIPSYLFVPLARGDTALRLGRDEIAIVKGVKCGGGESNWDTVVLKSVAYRLKEGDELWFESCNGRVSVTVNDRELMYVDLDV